MSGLTVVTILIAIAWIMNILTYPRGEYEIAARGKYSAILAAATVIETIAWLAIILNKV